MEETQIGKKIGQAVLCVWCMLTAFVSPVWLTLTWLYLSGRIYQYDASMDEGIAGILGVVFIVIWAAVALFPDFWFLNRIRKSRKILFACILGLMILFAVAATAMCNWNIVSFLTEPRGFSLGLEIPQSKIMGVGMEP